MKKKSEHRILMEYWSETATSARGFRPIISGKDAKQLKNIIEMRILSTEQMQKLMLYFLADRNYANLGPSIATMFSSTVLNSLINKMNNRDKFYKELEMYAKKFILDFENGKSYNENRSKLVQIQNATKLLVNKLSIKNVR